MAQVAEPMREREVTLEDCIQLALENNLAIQIERLGPQISTFDLKSSYGAYDPAFEFGVTRLQRDSPGGFDTIRQTLFPGAQVSQKQYDMGLSGQLPTGLTYDVGMNVRDTQSTSFFFDELTGQVIPREENAYTGDVSVRLRQPLLKDAWIDGQRMQIRLNRKSLEVSEQAFIYQVMQIVASVERAYYDLIAALENVKVQEKALELGDRTLAENRKRVEVGSMAPLDEKEAESQVATIRADLLSSRRLMDVAENTLKNLITDDYPTWQFVQLDPKYQLVALPQDFDVRTSWQKGLTMRPDLVQSRLNLEQQDIVLKYNYNQLFPRLDLVGSYGVAANRQNFDDWLNDVGEQSSPNHSFGLVLSIPLSRQNERYRYRSARAEKEQLLLRLKRLEQNIMVEIDNAVKLARTNFERVGATRAARQYAEAALEAEQKKLESGKSTTFVVLRLQRDLTDSRAAEIRALADYYRSLTSLALAEGTILQKNDVEILLDRY